MNRTQMILSLAASGLVFAIACGSDARETDRGGTPRVSPEVLAKGQNIYKATCAPCHGEGGKGDGPAGKIFKPAPQDHTNAAYMDTLTDEDMTKTINMGGALKGKPSMPSNPQIRGEDMTALVAFIRSLSRPEK
jgi:mono/diheme cytochrome c family protein